METVDTIGQHSIFSAVLGSGVVVQGVLILLILLSVWSWAIAIAKYLQFRRANGESKAFHATFREARNLARVDDTSRQLGNSPLAQVFAYGYRELTAIMQEERDANRNFQAEPDVAAVERALKRAEFEEGVRLEWGVTFLATVASAAPFIGLFGTVWGIMNAFQGLSTAKSSTIQAVAPGISEALVATAIGLAAAIPAAVAYNYFAVAIRRFRESMDKFSAEFLGIARNLLNTR